MKTSRFWSRAIAIAAIGAAAANAQAQRGPAEPQMRGDGPAPEARPFSITRADPALDQIVSPDAKLLELASPGDRIVVKGARDDTLSQFANELLSSLKN